MTPFIHWPQFNKTTEVKSGTSVLDAALDNDIPLQHACGGCCACTTCHIQIQKGSENISMMQSEEADRLESKADITLESRLGCQSKVMGDVTIVIPNFNS